MFLATASDAYLRVAVVAGRPGTPMEAWQGKLGAGEIEDVLTYVRTFARAVPPPPAPGASPAPSPVVPIVMNPKGKPPELDLRLGRYASVEDVAQAYDEKRRFVLIDARPSSDYLRAAHSWRDLGPVFRHARSRQGAERRHLGRLLLRLSARGVGTRPGGAPQTRLREHGDPR